MNAKPFAAVILAAGKGTRMKSSRSKVLHEIGGLSLIGHVIAVVEMAGASRTIVISGHDGEAVAAEAKVRAQNFDHGVQDPPQGTGHAVQVALNAVPDLAGFDGDVIVLFGDTPLLRTENIEALQRGRAEGASVVVLGFRPEDPSQYGRLMVCGEMAEGVHALDAIVEFKDAGPEERAVGFCNGGALLIEGAHVARLIGDLDNKNANGEYYLTDVVGLAVKAGLKAAAVEANADDVMGVNSRADLADAEAVFQGRARAEAMAAGATLRDPSTVYFSFDTKLGQDVVVGQNVVFAPGVDVADDVTIKPFSHLEGTRVGARAQVGPFARLRPEAKIGKDAKIGNFVEIKKATIKKGAKVSHLTYIGDAVVGAGTNIGAGTITCNYDGYNKYFTEIGHNVFVGSNSALVAPVKIGDGANIAAGSTVTTDVPGDALGVARGKQRNIDGWAGKYRAKMKARKEGKS
jgi:bifunctional UDP-N-acetylglucosamine pyrophosphorylase / glucosamine-1-phosphate N-acetyltransferase